MSKLPNIDGADLNSVIITGLYEGKGLQNAPTGGHLGLEVLALKSIEDANGVVIGQTAVFNGATCHRMHSKGIWGKWMHFNKDGLLEEWK
jgi:hypothetical protein